MEYKYFVESVHGDCTYNEFASFDKHECEKYMEEHFSVEIPLTLWEENLETGCAECIDMM